MRIRVLPLLLPLLFSACGACSPLYLFRASVEEARILAGRRPIDEMLADPATPDDVRRKLRFAQQARSFADEALGLDVGNSYTTFSRVERDTLALVLSAARRDRFEQVTWWFPIVGRIPYKGFFEEEDALDAAAELAADGYDVYLRPTSAFSTLGWFSDPLLSTLLRYDDVSLVTTVIHELTHNTLYLSGQAAFNESFANFVGSRGAIEYWCGVEGPESPACRTAAGRWQDAIRFGAFIEQLVSELEALYARSDLSTAQVLERRARVFAEARRRFREQVQPSFRVASYSSFLETPLNNATLIARRLYYHRLDRFETVYRASGRDLPLAIRRIVDAARQSPGDPYAALARLAASHSPAAHVYIARFRTEPGKSTRRTR
ncbi:MAG: aminopeptidase [Longimicrobiales bacterium]